MLDNQIARTFLCLHTPRADCNIIVSIFSALKPPLPPHAPCRLQRATFFMVETLSSFASTRPVQIATSASRSNVPTAHALPPHAPCRLQLIGYHLQDTIYSLPPHAPCRLQPVRDGRTLIAETTLPPHAPCRLQRNAHEPFHPGRLFASTRPVQIATAKSSRRAASRQLCLHTPRADCNATDLRAKFVAQHLCLHTPRADCNACVMRPRAR